MIFHKTRIEKNDNINTKMTVDGDNILKTH